uniref:Uncharacterized protein n=1 Tax=Sphingobacterium sp. (strain 21) TaxID=743722 RepID=F4C4C5_SPHS2
MDFFMLNLITINLSLRIKSYNKGLRKSKVIKRDEKP